MIRSAFAASLIVLCLGGSTAPGAAQDYPNRPIRLIVPFPPGGGTDLSARIVAEFLTQRLGQNVVVENKAGAGSQIGIDLAAKSKPDGYTLAWASSDGLSVIPAVKPSITYKVPDDFAFIATGVKTSPFLSINPKLPFKTVADLIAYGKANPGKLRYSSLGVGGAAHLTGEGLAKVAGIEMTHIPYSGSAPAIMAAVSGVVEFVLAGMGSVKSNLDSGQLRALATTDKERNPFYTDIPTLEESGIPLNVILYIGLVAPAGVPEPVLARLRAEMAELHKDPKVQERFKAIGSERAHISGDAFRDVIVRDLARWKEVAKSANITIAE